MNAQTLKNNAVTMLMLIGLSGCAMKPPIPDEVGNDFVLERDLVGKIVANGSFSAIDGTHREFVAYIDGSWDGNALTLVEDFEFSDGVEERKTWVLTRQENGEYSGVREDVVGTARGYQDGSAFRLDYTMALPKEDGTPGRKLKFRDVLVNDPNGDIINNATVGLWGLRVATVNLTMKRQDTAANNDLEEISHGAKTKRLKSASLAFRSGS